MSDVEPRDLIRDFVLRQAKEDPRIVAAAVIGSIASGSDDRWSDLDFTFGVTEDAAVADVMEDWSTKLIGGFGGITFSTFGVESLFTGCSYSQTGRRSTCRSPLAPRGSWGDRSSHSSARTRSGSSPRHRPTTRSRRGCCTRGTRWWRSSAAKSGTRSTASARCDRALTIACQRRDLPTGHGKGFDRLSHGACRDADSALVRSLDSAELRRALAAAAGVLLRQGEEVTDGLAEVKRQLNDLSANIAE